MVVMEALLGPTWTSLRELKGTERFQAGQAAREASKRAQHIALPTNGAVVVHGDLNSGNIMVCTANAKVEVRFVDFDWAGEAGTTGYLLSDVF